MDGPAKMVPLSTPRTTTQALSSSTQVLSSRHQDYIHDCKFDIYGRRMATCSGDRFVRVWDLTDSGEWTLVGEWQAHKASVNMLGWGHPEFGNLIATCGNDNEAKIWEERTNHSAASRWTAKAQLTEARKAVSCLEFSPRHWGLKLATGSADGYDKILHLSACVCVCDFHPILTVDCHLSLPVVFAFMKVRTVLQLLECD
jgi:nucleoporin SEH1